MLSRVLYQSNLEMPIICHPTTPIRFDLEEHKRETLQIKIDFNNCRTNIKTQSELLAKTKSTIERFLSNVLNQLVLVSRFWIISFFVCVFIFIFICLNLNRIETHSAVRQFIQMADVFHSDSGGSRCSQHWMPSASREQNLFSFRRKINFIVRWEEKMAIEARVKQKKLTTLFNSFSIF